MHNGIRLRRLRGTYKLIMRFRELTGNDLIRPRRLYQTWRVLPYTMVSLPRLANAYECVRSVIREGIPGDVVECGVWAGGCAGLMALAVRDAGDRQRRIHLFDSFEGLPQPSTKDGDAVVSAYQGDKRNLPLDDGSGRLTPINACVAPLVLVHELFFHVLRISEDLVQVHQGWFQDLLPTVVQSGQLRTLAVLRLDGDWYESTRTCLVHLYPLVQPGGFVIIDDYGFFEGCRRAVDEYLATLSPRPDLIRIDSDGVYLRKPRISA
jgi:O-methyltransferase